MPINKGDFFLGSIQQGMEQGEQKANFATARNLLQMGLPVAEVMQATGLSQEQTDDLNN